MQVALNRGGHRPHRQGAAQIDHLADRSDGTQFKRHINGGIAIKGLKRSAPGARKRRLQLNSPRDRVKTFHFPTVDLQWDRQLNRVKG